MYAGKNFDRMVDKKMSGGDEFEMNPIRSSIIN